MKRIVAFVLLILLLSQITVGAAVTLDGQTSSTTEELYPGVTATDYYLEEGYTFSENGKQYLRVLEFNPKQEDLSFDVVMAGQVGEKKTVSDIVSEFNETNTENKKVIAAVNGDLWMMAQYNARVEGSGTVFGGYSDAVVKQELCVPRGVDICDGEIICSQNMTLETPYEEAFQSFGIAEDGTPLIGNLRVKLSLKNVTTGAKAVTADGLNRLPSNNAVVVYSDKGPVSNYCLDDAYELVIDCEDYTICSGEQVKGTVVAICEPNSTRYTMQENRLIITARGEYGIPKLSGFSVGDSITLDVTLTDSYKNTEKWLTVKEAVGGHCVALRNGEDVNPGNQRYDPMTLIGFKADGNVVIIVNDGRQSWWSNGIDRSKFDELGEALGLDSVFLLDGGGSTTLVELTNEGYKLKNRVSDGATAVSAGVERPVINAVLISCINDEKEYSVTWKCDDEVLKTDTLEEGTVPAYSGSSPVKADDEYYTYTFAGWSKTKDSQTAEELTAITEDSVYYAVFSKSEKYTLGDIDKSGKINATDINLLKRVILGKEESSIMCDLNGDSKVNVTDVNLLMAIFLG